VLVARSLARRLAALAAAVTVVLGIAALRSASVHSAPVPAAVPAAAPVSLPDSIAFDVRYDGVGAEGVDLVWRGFVSGPVAGQATLRMEYAGGPADRRLAIWPVNAWLFFSADDLRSSFAAELSGSMNWKTGEMRVTGLVSDGVRLDSAIEQRMRLSQPGLAGTVTVRFLSPVATALAARGVS